MTEQQILWELRRHLILRWGAFLDAPHLEYIFPIGVSATGLREVAISIGTLSTTTQKQIFAIDAALERLHDLDH